MSRGLGDVYKRQRNVFPRSYGWSALITMAFALFVNFMMFYRLRKIDMIESLKSVE